MSVPNTGPLAVASSDGSTVCGAAGSFGPVVCQARACAVAVVDRAAVFMNADRVDACAARTGETCVFDCEQGYAVEASGGSSGVITCQDDGQFTPVRCVARACTVLEITDSDRAVTPCTGRTGDSCDFLCNAGYGSGGTVYCRADGTFSEASCAAEQCLSRVIPNSDRDGGNLCAGRTGDWCAFACQAGYWVDAAGISPQVRQCPNAQRQPNANPVPALQLHCLYSDGNQHGRGLRWEHGPIQHRQMHRAAVQPTSGAFLTPPVASPPSYPFQSAC